MDELTCIYCKKPKKDFNKEHVIPVTFGGSSKYLETLVCSDCNTTFNEEFEGRFLKGSGIESFFRAVEGKKGRRNYPVFGDGSYGNRVFTSIRSSAPPIQIIISKNNIQAPLQLIGITHEGNIIHSLYDDNSFEGNVQELLDQLCSESFKTEQISRFFLWMRATDVTVSNYRLIRKEFYRWLGKNNLDGEILCDDVVGSSIILNWETMERQRMFAKMCLNLLFWFYPERDVCLQSGLDKLRNFILYGEGEGEKLVHQWSSKSNPIVNSFGVEYDICIGFFQYHTRLLGTVYIPKIGLFLITMGEKVSLPDQPIREGLQEVLDKPCQFITTTNGNPLFCVIDQRICSQIKERIIKDSYFIEISSI